MQKKQVRNLLVSTMATALLGILTIGVATITAGAESYSESNNYFKTTGGTYTITNPTAAAQGVKLGVNPTEANGTVDLLFNGAGCLYNFDKKNYWGGEFHYKMADPTAVDAVMVTYRSTSDQDYSISFITTADGTYVSLTDDVTFQGNVPYANGAATPMTLDFTEDCATLSDMVIGFRPTTDPTQPTAYSTTEMFKGGSKSRTFNLLNSETMLAEAEDAGFYADRYTQAWIEQLCWDMSYSSAIMEISFVGVSDVEAGASIAIWTMNGFDYQAYVSGGYNPATNAIQRQQFDYNNLFVQKSKDVKFESSNGTTINGFPQLWEVWTPTTETGRAEINVDASKEYTYLAKDAMMYSYADPSLASSKTSGTTGNNMLSSGYHIFRPGLASPVVYYKSTNHAWAGRFNSTIKMTVTINGGAEQVIYVPDNKEFRLTDIPELSELGCLSATWVSGSGNFYTPGTEFKGTDTIKVHNEFNFKMVITTTEHTESTVAAVEATCTKIGKAEAKVCSVCEKVLSGGELVAAEGHAVDEVSYVWAGDNSTCTATAICANDNTHKVEEIATAISSVTQVKNCENDEISTYTATFKNTVFATQTKENIKTGDAIGHVYGDASYVWADDASSCKATIVCANDASHVVEETATGDAIVSEVTQNKDCTQDEITTYTASFTNDKFVAQAKKVVTAEKDTTNCTYGEVSYVWSDDNTTCTATRICSNNEEHVETETVTATKTVTQEATISQVELSKFEAAFANEAFAKQTKENVQTGDMLVESSTPDSSTSESDSSAAGSGCFGSISALSGVAVVLMAAGAIMVAVKRRKED